MNIELRDSAFTRTSNGKRIIQAKKNPGKKTTYKVDVEITGNDLPFVKQVTYKLHPTFRNNIKTVVRTLSNPNCTISFFAWGIFNIEATVEFLDGKKYRTSHFLRFNEDIQNNPTSILYI